MTDPVRPVAPRELRGNAKDYAELVAGRDYYRQWFRAALEAAFMAGVDAAADLLAAAPVPCAASPAEDLEQAFKAGYHCSWEGGRYYFDPAFKPGDPDGAYQAWLRATGEGARDGAEGCRAVRVPDPAAAQELANAPVVHGDRLQNPWPVYFGLVNVIAEHFGAEAYHVPADQLPQWLRARLRGAAAAVRPVEE